MMMFFVLGFVLLIALAVIGSLFFLMGKETANGVDKDAVLITDISEIKRQLAVDEKNVSASAPFEGEVDELSEAKAKLAILEKNAPVGNDPGTASNSAETFLGNDVKFSSVIGEDSSQEPAVSSTNPVTPQSRVKELELEVQLISEKAIRQAEEAVKVIEALMLENQSLKGSTGQPGSDAVEGSKTLLELREENSVLTNQLDLGASKISQLEMQLAVIKKNIGQQLLEANSTIARLKNENEAQGRVSQDSLLADKREMDEWREKTARQLLDNEQSLIHVKEENLLLRDAKKLLEAKLAVLEDDYKKELNDAKGLVAHLVNEKDGSQARSAELEVNVEKLKELNATLIDKAKILQFELNRQRAQASGLERVCSSFKSQLESLFEKVEEAKKSNDRLAQERSNLEMGVASLKSENSRLQERDRGYQLELEKTKEQMSRFENIYDKFKTGLKDVSKKDISGEDA